MVFLTIKFLYSIFLIVDVDTSDETFHLSAKEFWDGTLGACALRYT